MQRPSPVGLWPRPPVSAGVALGTSLPSQEGLRAPRAAQGAGQGESVLTEAETGPTACSGKARASLIPTHRPPGLSGPRVPRVARTVAWVQLVAWLPAGLASPLAPSRHCQRATPSPGAPPPPSPALRTRVICSTLIYPNADSGSSLVLVWWPVLRTQ